MTRRQTGRLALVIVVMVAAAVLGRHLVRRLPEVPAAPTRASVPAAAATTPQEAAATAQPGPRLAAAEQDRLLRLARRVAEGTSPEARELTAAPEGPAPGLGVAAADRPGDPGDGHRTALVSLSRSDRTALVAQAEGPGAAQAVAAAAGEIARRATAEEVRRGRLKVDLLIWSSEVERFDDEGRSRVDRSLEGLLLPGESLLLLPGELLSRRLTRSDGDLQSRRLRRYLVEGGRQPRALPGNPGKAGSPYRRLGFASFIEGPQGRAVELYRGNPLEPDLSPEALLAAAREGGEYLLRHQRPDGTFGYSYRPKRDEYDSGYNLLRHAGSCYALVELAQATGDDRYLEAARRGLAALLTHARPPRPADSETDFLAIVSPGEEAKLGGGALTVLALVQYQRAAGDDRWLPQARSLARFLLAQQDPDGHFRSKYFYGTPDPKPFDSIYYPGEAILALTRLYRIDPHPEWLAAAQRGADWLIEVRDAGKPTPALPHDHWLSMGLDELHALTGLERYPAHARRIAEAILQAQRRTARYPDWVGSFYTPPRSTPTATRAEALVAVHRLAARLGDDPSPYRQALVRMAAFQSRCQLTPASALYLPRPDLAVGGFRRSLTNWEVRIDYVQHNLSALLGLRSILLEEAAAR